MQDILSGYRTFFIVEVDAKALYIGSPEDRADIPQHITRDGTTEPVSRNQIIRRECGHIHFPC